MTTLATRIRTALAPLSDQVVRLGADLATGTVRSSLTPGGTVLTDHPRPASRSPLDPPRSADTLSLRLDSIADVDRVVEAVCERPDDIVVNITTVPNRFDPRQQERLWQIALRARILTVPTRCALARILASGVVHPASVAVVPLASRVEQPVVPEDPVTGPGPLAMTPARCRSDEGLENVLDALGTLNTNGVRLRYVVVADSDSTRDSAAAQRRFESAVRRRHLGNHVHWVNGDVLAAMAAAQIVVLPWDDDDLVASQSLVDALTIGVPVIATAFPHAVEAAATGAIHLVRPGSGSSLERGLHRLATRPLLRTAMRHAARAAQPSAPHSDRTVNWSPRPPLAIRAAIDSLVDS